MINNSLLHIITIYLAVINVATFCTYGIDKMKAKKSMWRIREGSLLMLAILGGSIGAWLGMKVWHHKTLHKKFRYGIPAIIIIQLALIGYLLQKQMVFLIDGVLKFQILVDYFGSYALVEFLLLQMVIIPTVAVYKLTKEK